VAKMVKKSFGTPEETRSVHKGKIEVVDLGGVKVMRVIHEPVWRWSECVKAAVGTDSRRRPNRWNLARRECRATL
jgi:hypothetical protein